MDCITEQKKIDCMEYKVEKGCLVKELFFDETTETGNCLERGRGDKSITFK